MTGGPFFPAAAPAEQPHPPNCACVPCLDALIEAVSQPLVFPAPRTDPAALDRKTSAYGDWLANRPPAERWGLVDTPPLRPAVPEANRATRGPGTGGGAGRRPSGPGRRRGGGRGGEGAPGGCASAGAALLALAVVALAAAAGLIWLAAH